VSTQRYISTSFWDDEWIQSLDPSEKLLYLYLMTNPLTNIAGVYKITDRRISFDTGFNIDTVKMILEKFEKAGKVYRMDEFIIIPSWPKHQKWETAPKIKSGIVSCLTKLDKNFLQKLVEIEYKFDLRIVYDTLSIPYPYPSNYSDLDLDLDTDLDTDINSEAPPPAVSKTSSSQKSEKAKKAPLRKREPANDMERVEKAYLLNWDILFSQGKVKTADPVVNWNQTRALLKRHFENLKSDLIIQAINDGMKDDWVLNKGYSLGVMLSAEVLNRLINSRNTGPPEEYKFGELSEGAVDIDALYNKFGLTGTEAEKRRKLIELRDQGVLSF
jgi:hypothetical protein